MSAPYTKIVYGEAAATAIGNVLGYAAADTDMTIKAISSETVKAVDGETAYVKVEGHGKEASGNIIIPTASIGAGYHGMIVQIAPKNAPAAWRPYRVTQWDEKVDDESSLAVCAFTAVSEDSMVEEYNLGPRDPESGELYGNKRLLPVNFINGNDPLATVEGKIFGLFAESLESGDGTAKVSRAKALSANAVALATCHNGRMDFYAVPGRYFFCQVSDGLVAGDRVGSTEEGFFADVLFAEAPSARGGDLYLTDTVS